MNRHDRRAQEKQRTEALRRANARLKTEMPLRYNQMDQITDDLLAEQTAEDLVPCQKGCAHCCEQMITVSLVEAEYLVVRYPRIVEEVRAELERQETLAQELGVDAMQSRGRTAREGLAALQSDASQRFLARWFYQRIPCAFLDPTTKTCRVYDARPIGCRTHFAVGHPPEVCDHRVDPDRPDQPEAAQMRALDTTSVLLSKPSQQISELDLARRQGALLMAPFPIAVLSALTSFKG